MNIQGIKASNSGITNCSMAHQKVPTHLMAYHETLLIAINYNFIAPRFRLLICTYFRGTIVVCTLNVLKGCYSARAYIHMVAYRYGSSASPSGTSQLPARLFMLTLICCIDNK